MTELPNFEGWPRLVRAPLRALYGWTFFSIFMAIEGGAIYFLWRWAGAFR